MVKRVGARFGVAKRNRHCGARDLGPDVQFVSSQIVRGGTHRARVRTIIKARVKA